MPGTSSEKYCVLCGEDCSGKPRVKDSHGNYYCKTCHQDAAQRKARRAAAPLPEKAEPPEAMEDGPMIDDLSISLDGDHDDASAGDGELKSADSAGPDEPSPVDEGPSIPAREQLDDDSDYAMRLGDESPADDDDLYSIMPDSVSPAPPTKQAEGDGPDAFSLLEEMAKGDSGGGPELEAMMDIEAPEVAPPPPTMFTPPVEEVASARTFWPYVIGTLALIFGGLFVTGATMTLLTNLAERADRSFIPDPVLDHVLLALVVPGIFALLGGWEVLAGFLVLLRKSIGARALRYWSRIILICVITGFLAQVGMMIYVTNRSAEGVNTAQKAGMVAAVIVVFGIVGLIALIWPIILLIWFRREKVQNDIESWG